MLPSLGGEPRVALRMLRFIAPFRRAYLRLPGELRGTLLILIATFGFSGMHVVARQLQSDLHAFEVAFFRNLFGLLALAPFFLRHGLGVLRTPKLALHATRAAIQVGGTVIFGSFPLTSASSDRDEWHCRLCSKDLHRFPLQ